MPRYTTEIFFDTISEHVSKLSYDWFIKKEASFKAHSKYNPSAEKIIITIKDRIYIGDFDNDGNPTGDEYEDNSMEVEIDLRRYCSCYFPIDEITDWGQWEYQDSADSTEPSNNVPEYAASLINEVSKFSTGLSDVVATSAFVSKTIQTIADEVAKLKDRSPANNVYSSVLTDFLNACSRALFRKYENVLTINELTKDFSDKLDFAISQEEMVSLLYILAKAGILKTPSLYEHDFIDFCFKYFTVLKKESSVRLTNKKTFTETYRRILRAENGEGLSKIKKKLDPVLSEIIEKSKKK